MKDVLKEAQQCFAPIAEDNVDRAHVSGVWKLVDESHNQLLDACLAMGKLKSAMPKTAKAIDDLSVHFESARKHIKAAMQAEAK